MPDGSYNAKPLDPEYFKNYYHRSKEAIECEVCGKTLASGSHMKRHRATNHCMLIELKKHFMALSVVEILAQETLHGTATLSEYHEGSL